jgi:hypothetical protein
MTIEDNTSYVLLPVYNEEVPGKTKGLFGSELKKLYKEEVLLDALEKGKTLIYKGNEYFLDERIS